MTTPAIAARGLVKRFGADAALRGIDFEVPAGESLAVLGPNGAGKSTLLRLIAGLARPSSGSLQILGEDTHHHRTRGRVGYIGHATLLYPALTARENLLFAARCHGVPEPGHRADRLLAEEGLAEFADRAAGAFSRGMAQRLAIARGLVHDPEVVLLDEPMTGLDGAAAARFAERVDRLRRSGRTLVLVTHDPRFAARAAERAIVLSAGRVAVAHEDALDPDQLERDYLSAGEAPA
ncbi:MAG: heme ABC exporter ATP-binding protein CcmA [Myxococcota bacterium]